MRKIKGSPSKIKKIETAIVIDKTNQGLIVKMPDGRIYKENFFSSKIIKLLDNIEKNDPIKVETKLKHHDYYSINPTFSKIIKIILPE